MAAAQPSVLFQDMPTTGRLALSGVISSSMLIYSATIAFMPAHGHAAEAWSTTYTWQDA